MNVCILDLKHSAIYYIDSTSSLDQGCLMYVWILDLKRSAIYCRFNLKFGPSLSNVHVLVRVHFGLHRIRQGNCYAASLGRCLFLLNAPRKLLASLCKLIASTAVALFIHLFILLKKGVSPVCCAEYTRCAGNDIIYKTGGGGGGGMHLWFTEHFRTFIYMQCTMFMASWVGSQCDHVWNVLPDNNKKFASRTIIKLNFKGIVLTIFHFKTSELHGPKCYQCLW